MEALKELCKTVEKEISVANDKIRAAGGKLTQGDVAYLDQLTHMMKSLKTTIAMQEAEQGGSHRYGGESNRGSYEGSNYQGGAYRDYESNRYVSPEYHESREGSYRDSYDEESYARRRDSMGRYM